MCPPKYYGIEYEINRWMSRLHGADPSLAQAQWDNLYRVITDVCGATVDLVDPEPHLPDLVFTANAGLMHDHRVIRSSKGGSRLTAIA
jgi:N-dimethylarginine dimethylaminohydrolase